MGAHTFKRKGFLLIGLVSFALAIGAFMLPHQAFAVDEAVASDTEAIAATIEGGRVAFLGEPEGDDPAAGDGDGSEINGGSSEGGSVGEGDGSGSGSSVGEGDGSEGSDGGGTGEGDGSEGEAEDYSWVVTEEGTSYVDSKTGEALTDWFLVEGSWYYANEDGFIQAGWIRPGGEGAAWYFLHDDGTMAASEWVPYHDAWYYLNANGAMASSEWVPYQGNWYYFNASGAMAASEWVPYGGDWYYFKGSGVMVYSEWIPYGGEWYYFEGGGTMASSEWVPYGGEWYYFYDSGAMATGWNSISGTRYFFNANGVLKNFSSGMDAKAQTYTSSTNWLIMVDTRNHVVSVYTGGYLNWTPQRTFLCGDGKSSTPTVRGSFTVGSKGYYFDSGNARCFYFTQFCGNYLFHSTLYYQYSTPSHIMDNRVGMGISHGCVRLEVGNAKYIYDNVPRGSRVIVY